MYIISLFNKEVALRSDPFLLLFLLASSAIDAIGEIQCLPAELQKHLQTHHQSTAHFFPS